jgi:hypothetical protein
MAEPTTMLIAAALNAGGQILGGIGAKQEARLNAFQFGTEDKLNKVLAMQQAQARREEYDLATSANIATFAAAGRDITTDRSVEAFLARQKEILQRDTSRIDQQAQFQSMKTSLAQMTERRRGRNALYSSLFSAAGTAGETIYRVDETKAPDGGKE